MEKFSLYDFVSFILPGGTILILFYLLLSGQNIQWIPNNLPEVSVVVIPFLMAAYLFGHLLSLFGKKIEKWIPGMKNPWTKYLEKNPTDALQINGYCLSLFGDGFYQENPGLIDINKSDKLYDRIYDYLEVQEKDKKIKILISQYGFFRNSSAVWFSLLIILVVLITMQLLKADLVTHSMGTIIGYAIGAIAMTFLSLWLTKQRKLVLMHIVYRTFLAINVRTKIN
jgi:hypothetical protein